VFSGTAQTPDRGRASPLPAAAQPFVRPVKRGATSDFGDYVNQHHRRGRQCRLSTCSSPPSYILRDAVPYADLSPAHFDRLNHQRLLHYHRRCLMNLGYEVTLKEKPLAA
jgi:hypothetical protein